MNVIFGSAYSKNNDILLNQLQLQAEKQFDSACIETASHPFFRSALITDDGAVLGHSHKDGVHVSLLGNVTKPVPKWTSAKSPVDDLNHTASHLIDLYKTNNQGFLNSIHGQFAIVIYDEHTNQLSLAVDKAEMRSIYYAEIQGGLVFSTNQYLLAKSLKEHFDYDRSYEDFFLIYGFLPSEKTFFSTIKNVKPGVVVTFDGNKLQEQKINEKDPWENSFSKTDWSTLTESQAIDVVYESFMSALEEQVTTEERVAVLLGGFDSALVASALHRLGKQVETFSFLYKDDRFNQEHTDTLQTFLGHKHHWVQINEEHIQNGLATYANKYNRPTNWPNYVIQTQVLCEEIRKLGIKHCYSGDGCDGIFLGYPIVHLRSKLFSLPIKLPPLFLKPVLWIAKFPIWEKMTGHVYTIVLNVLRSFARPWPERGHLTLRIFDELCLKRLRKKEPQQAVPLDALLKKMATGLEHLTPARLAYLGKGAISPNRVKISGSSDSTGVSIHAPYMHSGMAKLARSIPDKLCRPNEKTESKVTGKYILMRMAEEKGLLPRSCIYQKKLAAVDAPIDDWYELELKDFILEQLRDLPFAYDEEYIKEMLQQKSIEKLYKKHFAPDQICSSHTISLLMTYASFTKALKE